MLRYVLLLLTACSQHNGVLWYSGVLLLIGNHFIIIVNSQFGDFFSL